ncbi:MAG: CRISPR-associated protein Csx19 [Halothece sp.]
MNKPTCKNNIDVNQVKSDLKGWLENQAKKQEPNLKYLLAHAEDGVIWGRFEQDGTLITQTAPQDLFPKYKFAKLRWSTLQQCRIFGEKAEVLLWKVNDQPKARLVIDKEETEYICENQILWGTKAEKESNGFTLVSDGSQGLKHAVPLSGSFKGKDSRPLRLKVHHYIDYDESGVARISLSRLVNLDFDSNT